MRIRRRLPEDHRNADTRDVVKLTVGLIATMSALLLGLLVSAAKEFLRHRPGAKSSSWRPKSHFSTACWDFTARRLPRCGPGSRRPSSARSNKLWPELDGAAALDIQTGDALYGEIQSLSPRDDTQRIAKGPSRELGGGNRAASHLAACPIAPFHFHPTARGGRSLVGEHLFRFQSACAAERNRRPCLNRIRALGRRGDISHSGNGPALHRPDPDLERTAGQYGAPKPPGDEINPSLSLLSNTFFFCTSLQLL